MRYQFLFGTLLVVVALAVGYSLFTPTSGGQPTVSASVVSADPELDKANKLVETMPDSPMAYLQRAVLYSRRARQTADHSFNKSATADVEKALELDPNNFVARKLRLGLLGSNHEFDVAEIEAKKLVAEMPSDSFAYGILVDASVAMGNYPQAISSAQKMVDLRPDSLSYSRVALMRSLHGDHKGAVEMYQLSARTADPVDKEAQAWGKTQLATEYFKVGKIAAASAEVDQALIALPDYPNALIFKARLLAANGDLNGAETVIGSLNSRIKLTEALILTGDIARKKGDVATAMSYYEQSEKLERDQDGDIHRFALLWSDNDVKLAEALQVAEEDFKINKDIYASDILAWSLFKNGRALEAQKLIKEALRLNTNDARILYHAAMIEKALGNKAVARRHLEAALKANPYFDLNQSTIAQQTAVELGIKAS